MAILVNPLITCLYASSNLPTHEGFGLAIFPYLIYLVIFKKKLKIKHYLITIFFGLNSDFIFTFLALPSLVVLIFLLKFAHGALRKFQESLLFK